MSEPSRDYRLHRKPTAEERCEIATKLHSLGANSRFLSEVHETDAGYVAIETGDKQLKNAIGILEGGITFYTKDQSLLSLLAQQGLVAEESPFENDNSPHNLHRYQIPHIKVLAVEQLRPLFLTMLHDSIGYVQNPAI